MNKIKCQHHGLCGLKDFMDLKSVPPKNLCHPGNSCKSVMLTINADQ